MTKFLWLLGFTTAVIRLWVANFYFQSPPFPPVSSHTWFNFGRLCSWTKVLYFPFFYYYISTTFILTVCFTSAPSASWSLIRYTVSRGEWKKNGRPLIVFEQIFANHVYPLRGSPHPSVLQHTLFDGVPDERRCFETESVTSSLFLSLFSCPLWLPDQLRFCKVNIFWGWPNFWELTVKLKCVHGVFF